MVAVALIAVVATGNAYVLPAVGCVLMRGARMWMMGGTGGRGGGSDRS